MRYGMAMSVTLYDYETEEESTYTGTTGDYFKASRFTATVEDKGESGIFENYVYAWQALRRLGKLADHGLGDNLSIETIDAMADRYWVEIKAIETARPTRPSPRK